MATKSVYVCERCHFAYNKKDLAEKCEAWCSKYNSCNTEITKSAIGRLDLKDGSNN